eukprot:SAG11_NODE_27445_length_332_cov_1.545064_1_plen_110_part_11
MMPQPTQQLLRMLVVLSSLMGHSGKVCAHTPCLQHGIDEQTMRSMQRSTLCLSIDNFDFDVAHPGVVEELPRLLTDDGSLEGSRAQRVKDKLELMKQKRAARAAGRPQLV